MSGGENCPFCSIPSNRLLEADERVVVIADGFPISTGHTLIILKRHIGSWFECTPAEQQSLLQLMTTARARLRSQYSPDGFNIGINDGAAAGQTVPHLHIHLIPRYKGDRADPRGGIRWVLPEKADYWSKE